MTREIRFNAFDMNCVGRQSRRLWARARYRNLASARGARRAAQ
jgi:hypothetical protein